MVVIQSLTNGQKFYRLLYYLNFKIVISLIMGILRDFGIRNFTDILRWSCNFPQFS